MQYRSVTCIMQVTERYVHTSWLLIIHIITWPMTSVIASIRLMAYVTITHSHGSASVVRATKQVNGETQNLTPRHAQTPLATVIQIGTSDYVVDPYTCTTVRHDPPRRFVSAHA